MTITIHYCRDCGARVLRASRRCKPCHHASMKGMGPFAFADPAETAAIASAELQDRMEALFERTAHRRECSVEAAKLTLLYSPAQIEKMAA